VTCPEVVAEAALPEQELDVAALPPILKLAAVPVNPVPAPRYWPEIQILSEIAASVPPFAITNRP
jgi:hypothetical protein